jgi:hypothetical protein
MGIVRTTPWIMMSLTVGLIYVFVLTNECMCETHNLHNYTLCCVSSCSSSLPCHSKQQKQILNPKPFNPTKPHRPSENSSAFQMWEGLRSRCLYTVIGRIGKGQQPGTIRYIDYSTLLAKRHPIRFLKHVQKSSTQFYLQNVKRYAMPQASAKHASRPSR